MKHNFSYKLDTQERKKIISRDEDSEEDIHTANATVLKLKHTHVLKRGVTDIEHYGLKLAESSSYPPHIVDRAKVIATIIFESRTVWNLAFIIHIEKHINLFVGLLNISVFQGKKLAPESEQPEISNGQPSEKSLYLLGIQLRLACANFNKNTDPELIRQYFISLEQEFVTSFCDPKQVQVNYPDSQGSSYVSGN